jgi:hypothetical protein
MQTACRQMIMSDSEKMEYDTKWIMMKVYNKRREKLA